MGYAISIGAGLLVGIGLLIWALGERSKRHKAERAADAAAKERDDFERRAQENAESAAKSEEFAQRLSKQVDGLRTKIRELVLRLAKGAKPDDVREWLREELDEEEV